MNLTVLLFYFFIVVAVFSSTTMLFVKSVFHAALLLITSLLSLAGLYVLMRAEFLAITQILMYAGGVLVLIIFGIMLSSRLAGAPLNVQNTRTFLGYLVGTVFFFMIAFSIYATPFSSVEPSQPNIAVTSQQIGFDLMTSHLLPFEVAGILLLMSLVGATITASFLTKKRGDAN